MVATVARESTGECTAPGARLEVLGLEQRGQPSDPPFSRLTGAGYVAPVAAPYDRARRNGVTVTPVWRLYRDA